MLESRNRCTWWSPLICPTNFCTSSVTQLDFDKIFPHNAFQFLLPPLLLPIPSATSLSTSSILILNPQCINRLLKPLPAQPLSLSSATTAAWSKRTCVVWPPSSSVYAPVSRGC